MRGTTSSSTCESELPGILCVGDGAWTQYDIVMAGWSWCIVTSSFFIGVLLWCMVHCGWMVLDKKYMCVRDVEPLSSENLADVFWQEMLAGSSLKVSPHRSRRHHKRSWRHQKQWSRCQCEITNLKLHKIDVSLFYSKNIILTPLKIKRDSHSFITQPFILSILRKASPSCVPIPTSILSSIVVSVFVSMLLWCVTSGWMYTRWWHKG